MRYWTYLMIDTGGPESATVAEIGNYTSNVSNMWAMALDMPLADLHEKNAGEAIPILESAIADMNAHPGNYRAMNPPNGWGNFEGARDYLKKLLHACKENPKAFIYVSH
jgi:hypothetical protein